MKEEFPEKSTSVVKAGSLPRVLIATTAMLAFISFWRAAAVVLNDMGSSAFYAGAIAEHFIGKTGPWFILGIMCLAYAVCWVYIESCSMFVRGGVYRVVKEAMGGTLAKFSVSALMFDYILTAPISGVSAGLYLVGLLNELLRYVHSDVVLPMNSTAAVFAVLVTIYFWWQNIKGLRESSEKALRIMYVTTVMVVMMLIWCGYTLWVRGAHLPSWPHPANLVFSDDALGWLRPTRLPYTVGLIGILIGLGHSVLAMSGEETMAQVYREIEHPKLRNLEKVGFIIFVYSLVFTAGVAFFAVMIIPDQARPQYFGNLISGLAMNLVGPYKLRLGFQAFVVVVGILMLAGAVNTAIVGSNGVLNRVSEDGILPDWFRRPHHRFGTSYRILNLVVGLQLLTIVLSRGNIFLLGEAYAFGVMWSFAMKGLAVLVLRYKEPGKREFRVPLNLKVGNTELPLGLGLITLTLFALCIVNLFTKQVATISGVGFTIVFFAVFTTSERVTRKRGAAHPELDQFNLEPGEDLTPQALGVRPGNVLVMLRDYNTLYNLEAALDRCNTQNQDVVALHLRLLARAASGEHALEPEQLFSSKEQELFTRALAVAEKKGKTIHLAVAPAAEKWDGILRAAQSLQSSMIVLGLSPSRTLTEEARVAGLAWEQLPAPKPQLTLIICRPSGEQHLFFLGPHAPQLTSKEIDLLHHIWLELSCDVAPEELHHHDIVHFALGEVARELADGKREEILDRLKRHLEEIKERRDPHV
ncbi:MAG: APC family permease [Acidobacteria bacterium]|nr:MAG: APC family permease [Acidobacteriota bacterium]